MGDVLRQHCLSQALRAENYDVLAAGAEVERDRPVQRGGPVPVPVGERFEASESGALESALDATALFFLEFGGDDGVGARGPSSDWTTPRRPWHNNGDRLGLSELGAVTRVRLYPGPSPPRLSPLPTLPDCGGTSPAQRSSRTPSGQARAPPTTRSSASWRLCRRCAGVRRRPQRSARSPASRSEAEDSRAAERQRPSGRGPRARERRLQARLAQQPTPSVPTVAACARRAFRGTRVVARRNALAGSSSSTTPSGPTRPFRLAKVPRPGMTNTDVRDVIPGRRAGRHAGPWRFRPLPRTPSRGSPPRFADSPAISSVAINRRS